MKPRTTTEAPTIDANPESERRIASGAVEPRAKTVARPASRPLPELTDDLCDLCVSGLSHDHLVK